MNCTPDSNKDCCKYSQIYHQVALHQCKTSNLGPIIKLSQFPFHCEGEKCTFKLLYIIAKKRY